MDLFQLFYALLSLPQDWNEKWDNVVDARVLVRLLYVAVASQTPSLKIEDIPKIVDRVREVSPQDNTDVVYLRGILEVMRFVWESSDEDVVTSMEAVIRGLVYGPAAKQLEFICNREYDHVDPSVVNASFKRLLYVEATQEFDQELGQVVCTYSGMWLDRIDVMMDSWAEDWSKKMHPGLDVLSVLSRT